MGTFEYTHDRIGLVFSVRQDGTLGVADFGRGRNANGNEGVLAEIQLSGENHLNHHFGKHCASSESRSLKYDSRRIEKTEKGEKLIVVQKNDRIEVETVFEFFNGVNGYRVSNRVTGIQPVVLEFVSSFNAMAIEGGNSDWAENTDVIFVHNYWQGECQVKRYNLRELGLYKVADFSSKKISLSNVGTWSTMEYLPMCVVADKKGSGCFSVQLEGVAAWGLEIGTLEKSIYLNTYGPCTDLHSWAKKLEKGESYSTPATVVCFGKDEEDVFGEITAYRRAVRRYRLSGLPSVFNDYMHCLDT
ncbi:MAG: hypothetical protein ACI4S9_06500, partial [Christensenellales bacterium]